jgi:hypothetical protein
MATWITTDIEGDRFVIMRAVYGLICENKSHDQAALSDSAEQLAPLYLADPSHPQAEGNSMNHQQLSQRYQLSPVRSPHRDRCLDLTGRLRESTAVWTVPVPVCHSLASSWRYKQIRAVALNGIYILLCTNFVRLANFEKFKISTGIGSTKGEMGTGW